jgi:hypothetical protein
MSSQSAPTIRFLVTALNNGYTRCFLATDLNTQSSAASVPTSLPLELQTENVFYYEKKL